MKFLRDIIEEKRAGRVNGQDPSLQANEHQIDDIRPPVESPINAMPKAPEDDEEISMEEIDFDLKSLGISQNYDDDEGWVGAEAAEGAPIGGDVNGLHEMFTDEADDAEDEKPGTLNLQGFEISEASEDEMEDENAEPEASLSDALEEAVADLETLKIEADSEADDMTEAESEAEVEAASELEESAEDEAELAPEDAPALEADDQDADEMEMAEEEEAPEEVSEFEAELEEEAAELEADAPEMTAEADDEFLAAPEDEMPEDEMMEPAEVEAEADEAEADAEIEIEAVAEEDAADESAAEDEIAPEVEAVTEALMAEDAAEDTGLEPSELDDMAKSVEASADMPIAVPLPAAGRGAGGRSGRVKTRILGFSSPSTASEDPFEKAASTPAPAETSANFPVGWLVVVDGPGRGTSFTIFDGVTQIGRGEDQTVRLDFGDNSISRENHAAIAYDPEQQTFFIGHGGKANLVRVNNRPVLSTEELQSDDKVRIGETTLRFVAFCGHSFSWDRDEDIKHASAQ